MKLKYIFLTLVGLYTNYLTAQDSERIQELGIGFLTVYTTAPVPLYAHFNDSIPAGILEFIPLKTGNIDFKCNIPLNPTIMYGGNTNKEAEENINSGLVRIFPILRFTVTKESPYYFKVITNEKNFSQHYIKKSSKKNSIKYQYLYEDWEKYLQRAEYIELDTIEIYNKPNGKVIFKSNSTDFLPFEVEKVMGDWIKLKKNKLFYHKYKKGVNYEGWYQWKKENVLRINITEETYE